jgi:hypothetical protein
VDQDDDGAGAGRGFPGGVQAGGQHRL